MKTLLIVALLALCVRSAEAATIHLTAVDYEGGLPFPLGRGGPFPDIMIDAVLTLEPVTGLFPTRPYMDLTQQTNLVVRSVVGTMNGSAMSVYEPSEPPSWFTLSYHLFVFRFMTPERPYVIAWDGWFRLYGFPDPNDSLGFVPLSLQVTVIPDTVNFARAATMDVGVSEAVPVPDAAPSWLLLTGAMVGLALSKSRRHRRATSLAPRSPRPAFPPPT